MTCFVVIQCQWTHNKARFVVRRLQGLQQYCYLKNEGGCCYRECLFVNNTHIISQQAVIYSLSLCHNVHYTSIHFSTSCIPLALIQLVSSWNCFANHRNRPCVASSSSSISLFSIAWVELAMILCMPLDKEVSPAVCCFILSMSLLLNWEIMTSNQHCVYIYLFVRLFQQIVHFVWWIYENIAIIIVFI